MLLGCQFADPHLAGATPFDQTKRKITGWPNHANRILLPLNRVQGVHDGVMAPRSLDAVFT